MNSSPTSNTNGSPKSRPRQLVQARAVQRFKWSVLSVLIAVLVAVLFPVLMLQLYFSVHGYSPYGGSWWDAEFVGLELFEEVVTDPRFGWAIIRSLLFATGSTIGCFVIGFGLALLMYRPFRGQAFYYILFILPMLTVPIVIAYTGEMLLYQKGPVNDLLSSILNHQVNILWLANADTALLTVMVLEVWNWVPFSFIIMMAGLAALPDEPIEAAKILGASKWRIFCRNTTSTVKACHRFSFNPSFFRSNGRISKNVVLIPGRTRFCHGNDTDLSLHYNLAIF